MASQKRAEWAKSVEQRDFKGSSSRNPKEGVASCCLAVQLLIQITPRIERSV